MSKPGRDSLICALLTAAAVLATIPFVEAGINDDFSYTQIALHLANTGKLVYNGWNTPMLGFQAYWAALFIKAFGFSFTLVRLSALPFVMGASVLLYLVAVYAGVSRSRALTFACVAILSPLSLPLAASFMTDLPALFFLLAALIATLLATDRDTGPVASGTAVLAVAVTGLLGGSIRQVIFLAPALFLPYIALRSPAKWLRLWCAVCWCGVVLSAAAMLYWFQNQPYSTVMPLIPSRRAGFRVIGTNLAGLIAEFLILILPITVMSLTTARRLSSASRISLAAGSAMAAAAAVWAPALHIHIPSLPFAYFSANVITESGIFLSGVEMLGIKPRILAPSVQFGLVTAAIAFAALALSAMLPRPARTLARWRLIIAGRSNASRAIHLCVLFTAIYVPLLASRAIEGLAMDRYLLPLPALIGLPLIIWLPAAGGMSRRLSYAITVLFVCYAIATTHDYFAGARARLAATEFLTDRNVSRQNITAGAESDGWTEISVHGHVNDPRIVIPSHTYTPVARASTVAPQYWFWDETPAIRPSYYLVASPQPGLSIVPDASVDFATWMPPFRRRVYIQCDACSPPPHDPIQGAGSRSNGHNERSAGKL
jgi:hypothetical protein